MKEFIIENLSREETIRLSIVIINYSVALIAAFFIMFTYKVTYTGTAYSRKFNLTLGTITIVTTMIMSIISNNIALSLGMVGALSIIRYRTAIKDVRDASYIFWSIAVGIGCGVSQFALIGVGSIILFLFMLMTKQSLMDQRNLLIVQAKLEAQNDIKAVVDKHFGGKAHEIVKNVTSSNCEIIYTIQERVIVKSDEKNLIDISQRLIKIQGVERVNLVEQADDISR